MLCARKKQVSVRRWIQAQFLISLSVCSDCIPTCFSIWANFSQDWLPWWLRWWSVCLQCGRPGFNPWVRKFPGEGNGNPLQYSCLENPMDRGAWCPWGYKELDTTERLHFLSLLYLGKWNCVILLFWLCLILLNIVFGNSSVFLCVVALCSCFCIVFYYVNVSSWIHLTVDGHLDSF